MNRHAVAPLPTTRLFDFGERLTTVRTEKVMELSSGTLHHLTMVLMTQILILGSFVYGGMYLLKRRTNRQSALAGGPSIVTRETVLRGNTKLDLIVARETAESGQHEEEAGHPAEV
jgi:hypothetical protein